MGRNKAFLATLSYLHEMLGFVKDYSLEKGFDPLTADKIMLATEEALVNVIQYGYSSVSEGMIEIICDEYQNQKHGIKIIIKDNGVPIPFSPVDKAIQAAKELPKRLEEGKEGGYGVFLYVKIMDQVEYQRVGEINLLCLIKYFNH